MAAIRPASCYACEAPPITDAHVAALEAEDYVVIDGLFPRVDELRQALDDAEYRKPCSQKVSGPTACGGSPRKTASWAIRYGP